jgi:predicted phosphohydrolase
MKRLAWLTDIHLSCAEEAAVDRLADQFQQRGTEGVLIGGDIAEADSLIHYLEQLDARWARPVFFVLGNHDFYFSGISEVRQRVRQFVDTHPLWTYLTDGPPVALTPAVGLIGEDGWADAQLGNYEESFIGMQDYQLIEDLAGYDKMARWSVLRELGAASAARVRTALESAVKRFSHVYLLTHVPPFRESCWYNGQLSDDHWMPHFTCKAVGDVILSVMEQHAERRLTVLCGHTHGAGVCQPLPNVTVHTGDAEYGSPRIALELEL